MTRHTRGSRPMASRLEDIYTLLQQKRRYNPQYGREAIYEAARADAAGASQRLYAGKRLDLREQAQTQQAEQFQQSLTTGKEQFEQKQGMQEEQFAEQLAWEKERFGKTGEVQREQFAQGLSEQRRSSIAREREAAVSREAQVSAANKALTQSYINMGVQLPMSFLLMKQYLKG